MNLKTTVQKHFYRSGQLREEISLRGTQRHGRSRAWHKNGTLASEECFENGLLHGICRQWNESGRMLGKYTMIHGTGVQRTWHDNGRLGMEIPTVSGEFCGRCRSWLRDGRLVSNLVYLHGRLVNEDAYRQAARRDIALPKLARSRAASKRVSENEIFRVFVNSMLAKRSRREAGAWLNGARNRARSLGRFKRAKQAIAFVADLYESGAVDVIAPDIYRGSSGAQFADCLLVRLPRTSADRKAVRQACTRIVNQGLGTAQPDNDIGETHLFLSLA